MLRANDYDPACEEHGGYWLLDLCFEFHVRYRHWHETNYVYARVRT